MESRCTWALVTGFCHCMLSRSPGAAVSASGSCLPWLWQRRRLSPSSLLYISGSDSSCSKDTETNSLHSRRCWWSFSKKMIMAEYGGCIRGPSLGKERTSSRGWKMGNILGHFMILRYLGGFVVGRFTILLLELARGSEGRTDCSYTRPAKGLVRSGGW